MGGGEGGLKLLKIKKTNMWSLLLLLALIFINPLHMAFFFLTPVSLNQHTFGKILARKMNKVEFFFMICIDT